MPSQEASALIAYGVAALAAYLVGSVPIGAVVARLYRNLDLTQVGSERTGATNAIRTMGLGAGLVVLIGDFVKGMAAVWVARAVVGAPSAEGLALLLAVVGHTHSVFLRWRGGRGVGTGLGGLAVLAPGIFIIACLSGCLVAGTTRYMSLGSIAGSLAALVAGLGAYFTGSLPIGPLPFVVAGSLLVVGAHADNLRRLRAGTERRFGQRDVESSKFKVQS